MLWFRIICRYFQTRAQLGVYKTKLKRTILIVRELILHALQEASKRFNREVETKEKVRQEKIEMAEKLQREIYLNGGFVDCVNSGKT